MTSEALQEVKVISGEDIETMDKKPRLQLINAIVGFKSANLIGTTNNQQQHNLAVFSSGIHLGSSPPFIGLVFRPLTVPRDTYTNIRDIGYYTMNHIYETMIEAAHQTSGKYDSNVSEFDACGLTPEFSEHYPAPYVHESKIKMTLKYVEEHEISANQTVLMVGRIVEIRAPEAVFHQDNYIDPSMAGTVALSGLDGYHKVERADRKGHVKV